jgi:hypothetical protein
MPAMQEKPSARCPASTLRNVRLRWRAIDLASCSVMARQFPVRFLVALPSASDLLLFAKDLLLAAIVAIVAAGDPPVP